MNDIKLTLKLFLLTAVIPLSFTIICLACLFLGVEMKINSFKDVISFWADYYINKNSLGVDAWRIHAVFIVGIFIFVKLNKIN